MDGATRDAVEWVTGRDERGEGVGGTRRPMQTRGGERHGVDGWGASMGSPAWVARSCRSSPNCMRGSKPENYGKHQAEGVFKGTYWISRVFTKP